MAHITNVSDTEAVVAEAGGASERVIRRTLAELQAAPPAWWTLDDVATWLGVSKSLVEVAVRTGELRSNKFRGARRISRAALQEYEQATEQQVSA